GIVPGSLAGPAGDAEPGGPGNSLRVDRQVCPPGTVDAGTGGEGGGQPAVTGGATRPWLASFTEGVESRRLSGTSRACGSRGGAVACGGGALGPWPAERVAALSTGM